MTEDIGKPPINFTQPTNPPAEVRANICPHCGAPVHFGDSTETTCEYCGNDVEKIAPPTQSQGEDKDEHRGEDEYGSSRQYYGSGYSGFNPMMNYLLLYALINSHSTYTSTYTGMSSVHPAHFHGVGGFSG